MKMLRLLLAAALILAPFEQALAGAGTITTKDAAGATRTFVIVTDGTGNFVAPTVICDATAAATCAAVGAAGVKVDGSGATQPVSGTVTANIGTAGTLATQTTLASIDTKTPALGQALAAASVPVILPAATITTLTPPTTVTANIGTVGTLATAAKQPALGTAGSASTDVISVQGIASMTPLLANPGTAANWGVGTATQNSATVANGQLALAQFNTTPTTITSGNMSPLQMDNAGKLLVNCTGCSSSSAITSWGGGTLGAMANYGTSPGAVLVPGINAFVTNSNANGSATSANSSPTVIASDQVAIAVKNNGGAYETVAASQTGQALGATGATGDYLSHCVIYPVTTSPGVVTVFDNTNAAGTNAIAFAGGATSTSNLTPIAVPVGAISTAGAWKVTTGANVIVTCYGKFT